VGTRPDGFVGVHGDFLTIVCVNPDFELVEKTKLICEKHLSASVCGQDILKAVCISPEEAHERLKLLSSSTDTSLSYYHFGVSRRRALQWSLRSHRIRKVYASSIEEIQEAAIDLDNYLEVTDKSPSTGPRIFVRIRHILSREIDIESELRTPVSYRLEDPRFGNVVAHTGHSVVVIYPPIH